MIFCEIYEINFTYKCLDKICLRNTALKINSLVGNINDDLVKYFMQHVQNGLIIHLTNSFKNNIC